MRLEHDRRSGPRWRAILEARWRLRLEEVTELSVAYHSAAADNSGAGDQGENQDRARRLLRRAVAARQRLAETEEALGRVAAGGFGRCEQCGSPIPVTLLSAAPEGRYCDRCATRAVTAAPGAPAPAGAAAARR
jgi:DnaK suppressor protein